MSVASRGAEKAMRRRGDRKRLRRIRGQAAPAERGLIQTLAAHGEEFLTPLGAKPGAVMPAELGQRDVDGVAQGFDRLAAVAMGAAERLHYDFVDDTQL